MKSASTNLIPGLLIAWLASFGGVAAAQSTWQLGGSSCNPGNPTSCAVGGTTATMYAIGNTGSGETFVTGTLNEYDPNGFGAKTGANETGTDGHHAFDNVTKGCVQNSPNATDGCGGSTEALVIGFGAAKVNLTSLAIGWGGDSDISVLRWDGAASATAPSFTNVGVTGLGAAGWTLISSMDVDAAGAPFDNPNTSPATAPNDGAYQFIVKNGVGYSAANNNKVSSWWMISTYFGSNNSAGYLEAGDDRFKLLNFAVSVCGSGVTGGNSGNGGTCKVSEPGSLALVAISLMGFVYSRRKALGLVGSGAGHPRTAGAC